MKVVFSVPLAILLAGFQSLFAANLALQGTASQTSTLVNSAIPVASKAIDGNRDGNFNNGSVSHTTGGTDNDQWMVDLGAAKVVDSITLWNRSDCCTNRLSNVRISVLDSSFNEIYGVDIPNSNPVTNSPFVRGFPIPFGTVGRYVRVMSLPGANAYGDNVVSLAEVEVWGHQSLQNLARHPLATANQSSTGSGGVASRAIDGNTDPTFNNGSVSHTDPAVTGEVWWEVNLNGSSLISEVWLYNRGDCCGDRLSNFRLSVFSGSVETYGENFYVGSGNVPQGGAFAKTFTQPVEGDRVRISLINGTNNAGNSILALTEVQVFGQAGADVTPPLLIEAGNISSNVVRVQFSEPVSADTATNVSNYALSNSAGQIAIYTAVLDGFRGDAVLLTTMPLVSGDVCELSVTGIRDRSAAGNLLAANSRLSFTVKPFYMMQVGDGPTTNTFMQVSNGFDVVGGGTSILGASDQFTFGFQQYTGDFDVKVRLERLEFADVWTQAGLMARETLGADSRFAGVFATPSLGGTFFKYRSAQATNTTSRGNFPTTYPQTWLRLQRSGNTFTGYAGVDGQNWLTLGSVNLSMPVTVYFGLAMSSASASTNVTASFRDFGPVSSGVTTNTFALPTEPPGPTSRRTGLSITEIMYNPKRPAGMTNSLEFIELFNGYALDERMDGWRVTGSINFTFPTGFVLKAGAYVVLARDPDAVRNYYGIANVIGPWDNAATDGLPANGGTIRLRNRQGAVLLEVKYNNRLPWPVAADGTGHSLVLSCPSLGESNPAAWSHSRRIGGSPGGPEPWDADALDSVVINEFRANSIAPETDFIELYNHGNSPVDISGAFLSDTANTNKYQIPAGRLLPARGFMAFTTNELRFGLKSEGGRIYLVNSNQTRVIDVVEYEGQARRISSGRSADGAPYFYELSTPTPGAPNAPILQRPIVINEIMYSPISGNSDEEYIELYNRGTNTVDLSGWQFVSGIGFTFPNGVQLAPGGFLVVAKNAALLRSRYSQLNANNCLGDFSGTLANGGERVALAMPEYMLATNGNTVTTNIHYVVVNEVTYKDGGRWPLWADGGGSSLELKDPHSDNRLAANWADSDETAKSSWGTFSLNYSMGENLYNPSNDNVHIYLLGMGECLVDNVEVHINNGPNLVSNPGFDSGITGWTPQGSHDMSTVESCPDGNVLHVRAGSRGDAGANKIRSASWTPVANGSGTWNFYIKARWLRGWPELLVRVHGGTGEMPCKLPIPTNLGTPGLPNSRYVGNTGPAVFDVTHNPPLPAPNQPVVVSTRVSDPDGIASVSLKYRLDPGSSYLSIPMVDDGTGGDAVAGDGVYSATIPGQASNTLAAFYIEALDSANATNTFPQNVFPPDGLTRCFPNDSPARECLVRWGDIQMYGAFATYHLWITTATSNRWYSRDNLNNALLDATFVYNNQRVVYNAGVMYSGSPFHRGQMTTGPMGNNRCDYILVVPPDDLVLGETDFVLNLPGNGSGGNTTDPSGMGEQISLICFYEMDVPSLFRRYMHLFVNGSQRSTAGNISGNFILEDAQQPNSDVVKEWFPDDPDGELIKIEDWFEFNDSATGFQNNDADFQRREVVINTTNSLNYARYRYMWRKRAVGPGESANDYSNWIPLLNAISPTTDDNAAVNFTNFNAQADVHQWMREFACQRAVGNFDSYGFARGKNNYIYKPKNGRWVFLPWDVDWVLAQGSRAYNEPIFTSSDPRAVQMYNEPNIRRAYMRSLKELVERSYSNAFLDPFIQARMDAFAANGVSFNSNTVNQVKSYIAARRDFLISQLQGYTNAFSLTTTTVTASNNNVVTLSGKAPVDVYGLRVNGWDYPVSWAADFVTWTLSVPISSVGTNQMVIQAFDRNGNNLAGMSGTATVVYTGPLPAPEQSIVINEIMYRPTVPGAEYVELYNIATNVTFDLSGWRINGLNYTFPGGSRIGPGSFIVLAKDRTAYQTAYGTGAPLFDTFNGNLQSDGETLTLLRPAGPNQTNEIVVDKVRYEPNPPWPASAAGGGASLQLLDPTRDNSRVANWQEMAGWRFASYTGTNSGTVTPGILMLLPQGPGDVYIDDLSVVEGTNAGVGFNVITNGDFEAPLAGTWYVGTNLINSMIVTNVKHSGNSCLLMRATSLGTLYPTSINQTNQFLATTNAIFTVSFWYLPVSLSNIIVRTRSSAFAPRFNVAPAAPYTPGAPPTIATTLPELPQIWLNEVQPENRNGPADNMGEREPWLELYNSSSQPISLDGWWLTDNYTNLLRWSFPSGTTLAPGQFMVVWADGQPEQTADNNLHTSFRLPPTNGSVALVMPGQRILDYLNYTNVPAGYSYGNVPDAQPFNRQVMGYATPGATNNPARPPLNVRINEWMASNTRTLLPPSSGTYDDWFELFNPGPDVALLGGYYLTDDLNNPFQFRIPDGFSIPAGGFLLVWADNKPYLNTNNTADLHVNFQLSRNGEAIGLFDPDGQVVDAVVFGPQTNDVSQGRLPDGSSNIVFLATPTPRAPNGTNSTVTPEPGPPQVAPISNVSIVEGTTLQFAVQALDTNQPPVPLSFFLSPDAPSGAGIEVGTGLLTWTPTEAQGPGLYTLTIIVAQTASPFLSVTRSFTVEVTESNLPPVINPVPQQIVNVGQQLSLAISATDADLPANRLTYSLGTGSPTNAAINPTNGLLSWQPLASQAGTNWLELVVVDDGVPPLSATQMVAIVVVPPPENLGIVRLTNSVRLSWRVFPGKTYQLLQNDNLQGLQSSWTSSGSPITATNDTLIIEQAITSRSRYYRLKQLD